MSQTESKDTQELKIAQANVYTEVTVDLNVIKGRNVVKGYDLNNGVNWSQIFSNYPCIGLQATAVGHSISIVNKMINWKLASDTVVEHNPEDLEDPSKNRCKIFLGYTSSCVTSGVRETIRYLCQHKMINVIVTTATGIDEDLMKCLKPHNLTNFTGIHNSQYNNEATHKQGNIAIEEKSINLYENWLIGEISKMHDEQDRDGKYWTPSEICKRLGEAINDKSSILYWCYINDIPIYSPGLTDGDFGDILYRYNKKRPGFIVDIAYDIRGMNKEALTAKKTGVIILGGGLIKHHILNANLMRNGADYAVFINTGHEFEGSDAGAKPQEALSWGKLKLDCDFVKVYSEASLVFPLVVSQSFAKFEKQASRL